MTNTTTELASEYRLVEQQVREKYKEVFDQIEEELREKWSAVWAEMGHDPARIQVKVEPRITVFLTDTEDEYSDEPREK